MTGHGYLIVECVANYAPLVNNVGYPRCAQAESSPYLVQPRHHSFGVAGHGKGNSAFFGKSLETRHAVGTDAHNLRVVCLEDSVEVSKLPGFRSSTVGKGARVKVQDQPGSPEAVQRKFSARTQGQSEDRRCDSEFQHEKPTWGSRLMNAFTTSGQETGLILRFD